MLYVVVEDSPAGLIDLEDIARSAVVGVLETWDRAIDFDGATLSSLTLLDLLLLIFDTTDGLSSRFSAGDPVSDLAADLLGRYTASMLFPSKSTTAAL